MGFQAVGVGSSPVDKEQMKLAAQEGLPKSHRLEIVVSKLRYYAKETGFFVIEGRPLGAIPEVPQGFEGEVPRLENLVSVKGASNLFANNDHVGGTIACFGTWILDPTYGLQFESLFIQDVLPTNPSGLLRYLSRGYLKGIGPSLASQMIKKWGMDVLRILDEDPEKLAELPGLTEEKARKIGKQWEDRKRDFEFVAFFGEFGIGEATARKIRDQLSDDGLMMRIRANPYLITEVDGVGFKTADQMAQSLGFAADHPMRVQAALDQVLIDRIQNAGHTAVPMQEWMALSAQYLLQPPEKLLDSAEKLIKSGRIVRRRLPMTVEEGSGLVRVDMDCVSPASIVHNEKILAGWLAANKSHNKELTKRQLVDRVDALSQVRLPSFHLDPSQQVAAWMALTAPCSVMTGGPGTGKTTTIRTITAILNSQRKRLRLSAPTGRASKRMEEAVGMPASTIHRALEYNPQQGGFQRNEMTPMEEDFFIVDESSMVDQSLASSYVRAIRPGARLLWVGDVDQLPSVGAGDVLRNIIDSSAVPVARLKTVHRQAKGSAIAYNAQRILGGHPPSLEGVPERDDFAFFQAKDNEGIIEGVERMTRLALSLGFKAADIQVLCPQKTGPVGTEAMNEILRPILNPNAPPPPEGSSRPWRVGDRLMQTKNNYDKNIFNGDMGIVLDMHDDGSVDLQMEDGRVVDLTRKETYDLQVGFAITVHKSQGGERPVIIMPMAPAHTYMLDRNLVYTGVTRGKQKVFLVGSPKTAVIAISKKSQVVRLTGLKQEIATAFVESPRPRVGM